MRLCHCATIWCDGIMTGRADDPSSESKIRSRSPARIPEWIARTPN
jgi:hypothetical protein